MRKINTGDKVIIKPTPPIVGKVLRVWTFSQQAEIEWPSGFRSIISITNLEKIEKED